MARAIDISAQRFGRWTAIAFAGRGGHKGRERLWSVVCDCGATGSLSTSTLTSGNSRSCGCFRSETTSKRSTKHGGAVGGASKIYMIYNEIVARCTRPTHASYGSYGGRGITCCDRWLTGDGAIGGFECFNVDMGPRPPGTSVDRKDNNSGYCPENCRWATTIEQASNKRNLPKYEFGGKTLGLSEWARELGVTRGMLKSRIRYGWSIERILTEPVRPSRRVV